MGFQKATKKQAKLRLAIFGPAGAGKTYTALRIAKGIGGKIAVVDSEEKTASKYADRFDFDVQDLEKKTVAEYVSWINEASALGYDVLIIDSMSHAWQELLEEIDQLAKGKYKGNTWSAWSEGTPKQRMLVQAILRCKCHVIATMRSKTEWSVEQGSGGKTKPVRVGLAPEQGKGIEYEFDILMEMSTEHIGNVIKDRTGKFQDEIMTKPGEDFGKQLLDWLSTGEADIHRDQIDPEMEKKLKHFHAIGTECYGSNWDTKRKEQVKAVTKGRTESSKDLKIEELDKLISHLDKNKEKIKKANAEASADKGSSGNNPSADQTGGKGIDDTIKSLHENLMQKINAIDTIIDLIQFVQQDSKMIDLVKEESLIAEITVALNAKAEQYGVDISKLNSAA